MLMKMFTDIRQETIKVKVKQKMIRLLQTKTVPQHQIRIKPIKIRHQAIQIKTVIVMIKTAVPAIKIQTKMMTA